MKKIFVGNLPQEASEQKINELFSRYGTVRSIHIPSNIFTGKCRGFGFVEMEGHEARAAISGLNGIALDGKFIKVRFESVHAKRIQRKRK